MTKTRGWYMQTYGEDYTRKSVKNLEGFQGWGLLQELIDECRNTEYRPSPVWMNYLNTKDVEEYREHLTKRDQALIATLFLTGGRVNETAQLRKSNFKTEETPQGTWILVTGMAVLKGFKKIGVDEVTNKWITEKVHQTRGRFPIPGDEPLVPYMMDWVEQSEDHLFTSPAKHRAHISGMRVYQIIRDIGQRCGVEIWPHWFRAQRASQIFAEYGYSPHQLKEWFSWKDIDTALHYAKFSTSDHMAKMRPEWRTEAAKHE